MRIAALYDIHGNLPALEAVLAEIAETGVDRIIVGGDVVAGPLPSETLARLQELTTPTQFLQGNADREVLAQIAGHDASAVPEAILPLARWVASVLSPQQAQFIANCPPTLNAHLAGLGDVLFCHATPRSDTEVFTRLTAEERIAPAFAGIDVALVICGHTHMQFDRMIGTTRVVNAGSVGMPYGAPGACWLLLGPSVEFRRTPYDYADAARRIGASTYPEAADFAANNVLQTPSEAEALAVMSQMEH